MSWRTKWSSSGSVRAWLAASCSPMVEDRAPLAGPEEQNEPNPWVGNSAASGPASAARRRTEAYWSWVKPTVSASATRSVRPTEPYRRLPPEKTACFPPSSTMNDRWVCVWPGVATALTVSEPTRTVWPSVMGVRSNLDGVGGVDEIAGAVGAGQDQPAGDVVIVHVRFGHVRDGYPGVTGGRLDAVRVALRVDRQRHRAVVDQVAAVPELRGLDDDDFHGPSGAVSPLKVSPG